MKNFFDMKKKEIKKKEILKTYEKLCQIEFLKSARRESLLYVCKKSFEGRRRKRIKNSKQIFEFFGYFETEVRFLIF